MQTFEPSRLRCARELRGYTTSEMATKLDVPKKQYRGWEVQDYRIIPPCEEVVGKMAFILSFPLAWFYAGELDLLRPNQINGWVSGSQFMDEEIDADMASVAPQPITVTDS